MSTTDQTKPLIKFAVQQDQHDLIRLAGALRRTSMAEFARASVLQEAQRITAGLSSRPGIEKLPIHASK